jgi:hypothetical protein
MRHNTNLNGHRGAYHPYRTPYMATRGLRPRRQPTLSNVNEAHVLKETLSGRDASLNSTQYDHLAVRPLVRLCTFHLIPTDPSTNIIA